VAQSSQPSSVRVDVGERHVGPADGDFVPVVGAVSVGDDGDELACPVEDAGIAGG
jgi:hypothetical protein